MAPAKYQSVMAKKAKPPATAKCTHKLTLKAASWKLPRHERVSR